MTTIKRIYRDELYAGLKVLLASMDSKCSIALKANLINSIDTDMLNLSFELQMEIRKESKKV